MQLPIAGMQAAQPPANAYGAPQLEAAMNFSNKVLQSSNATLQFEMDKEAHVMVIRLVDTTTKQVIRQIPNQTMLDISKSIEQMQGVLMRDTA